MPIQFKQVTDGFAFERNDCTVRAVSNACDMSYARAHALLEAAGRRDRHRFAFKSFMSGRRILHGHINGHKITHVDAGRRTLAQVVRDFPRGTFILRKSGHVFCVRDSVVLDSFEPGARVRIIDLWHIA